MPTNEDRAAWVRQLIEFPPHDAHDDIEDALVDLMTDLLHLANISGIDVESMIETVKLHFDAELLPEAN